jgi:hypothetical protein
MVVSKSKAQTILVQISRVFMAMVFNHTFNNISVRRITLDEMFIMVRTKYQNKTQNNLIMMQ